MSLLFDVESIPEDEGLALDLVEKKKQFQIELEECILARDVGIRGTLTRVGREAFFNGEVTTALHLICSRCLEPFEMEVDAPVSACFMPQPAHEPEEEHELHAADIEVEYYRENNIDLSQPVYDQILLTLPFVRLCRPDCKGLCPHCGINRNVGTCQCGEARNVDPRLAVLEQLKNKLK